MLPENVSHDRWWDVRHARRNVGPSGRGDAICFERWAWARPLLLRTILIRMLLDPARLRPKRKGLLSERDKQGILYFGSAAELHKFLSVEK